MKQSCTFLSALVLTGAAFSASAAQVDFNRHVKPILESTCLSCHGVDKPKGGLSIVDKASAFKGGDNGVAIVAGQPDKSPLYTSTVLPPNHDNIMPPKGDTLTKEQAGVLKDWIQQGATWPNGVTLKQVQRMSFVKDIQPILEFNCVACHREDYDKGGLKLDSKIGAFNSGDSGASIIPFFPEKSSSYTSTIKSADEDGVMPPKAKGGPLAKDKSDFLKLWIEQGAPWPDGIKLTPKKAEEAGGDELAIVAELYKKIVATHKEKTQAEMKEYSTTLPGTQVQYHMLPIQAGQFVMGSPETEKGRKKDEGPQHKVAIEAFWMGKFEVTWNEYELFMYPDESTRVIAGPGVTGEKLVDAVSRPTKPYVEMSFGMGKDGFPAISMTQHAANKYCQWLSSRTGHFYRLPTEAEWEYACRAGTTTAYSWGDDPAAIKEYSWYEGNSNFKYQKVGKKKPNPWGLFDMHGNVAEWCLDQYEPDYSSFKDAVTQSPYVKQTKPYPHVARGGSWDDVPELLRSAVRRASSAAWKQQDPQLPKSIWYHTDAQFLGFRVVRPLKVPTQEEMMRYWNNGVQND